MIVNHTLQTYNIFTESNVNLLLESETFKAKC